MFSLLRTASGLQLSMDLQLHLFEKVVTPDISYGCESCTILDKLQLQFYKYILKLNQITCCNSMIYREPGVIPISIQSKCRLLKFWVRLVNDTECKLSNIFNYLSYIRWTSPYSFYT